MRVLVVFCEGPHDVYFASRSLARHSDYEEYKGPASGLPTPFGWSAQDPLDKQEGLVLTQVRRLDPLSIGLGQLNFGKKPLFEHALRSADGSSWALFVNMGGDSASKEVNLLLRRLRASRLKPGIDLQFAAFAFLFDADFTADGRGLGWRVQKFKADYKEAMGSMDNAKSGAWWGTDRGPVGLWVHHSSASQDGTLENVAGPVFAEHADWKVLVAAAGTYIDAHGAEDAPARSNPDKRWKASITIAGQLRPDSNGKGALAGSGMNVMIQRGLHDDGFDAAVCKELATFLTTVPWPNP